MQKDQSKSKPKQKLLISPIRRDVLQIIGLSQKPLSSREIENEWLRHSSCRQNSYIYEVIKDLYKPEYLGQRYQERFLKLFYKENVKNEIELLERKIKNLESYEHEEWAPTIKRIDELRLNPQNWRYSLNFKGFLLYLIASYENQKISYRVINIIINNLKDKEEFNFLNYIDIYERNLKINLLIKIALELQFQFKTLTPEYLSYHLKNRLYEEITLDISFKTDPMIDRLLLLGSKNKNEELSRQEQEHQAARLLSERKISLLNDLISYEQKKVEKMMLDKMETEKEILKKAIRPKASERKS